jgi:hypothetical protein
MRPGECQLILLEGGPLEDFQLHFLWLGLFSRPLPMSDTVSGGLTLLQRGEGGWLSRGRRWTEKGLGFTGKKEAGAAR